MSQYLNFVDLKYKPRKNDLICLFRIEPSRGISFNEAAGRVAAESSNGTWTTLTTLKKHIEKILSRTLSEDDYTILSQEQLLSSILQILSVLTAGLGGIAAISLIVGGVGISNIMLVSVTERTREIGLRKAVGAKPRDILQQFLAEAIILSVSGGTIGITLGFLGSLAISNFVQTAVPIWAVALGLGFSTLVGVIFGVAPAIRAARLEPIEALRHE